MSRPLLAAALGLALAVVAGQGGAASGLVRSGTAFFVSGSGDLLTSGHVVRGCSEVSLYPAEGDRVSAKVVAVASDPDAALLSTSGKAPRVATAAAEPPRQETELATVGFGVLQHWPRLPVLSRGRFRGAAATPSGQQVFLFEADLPEGNSGGPVIDGRGDLIGMVVGREAQPPRYTVVVTLPDLVRFLAEHGRRGPLTAPPRGGERGAAEVLYGISALVQCAAAG